MDNLPWSKGVNQETKNFMLLFWLQDMAQKDQEQVQVTWLGAELKVTWQNEV